MRREDPYLADCVVCGQPAVEVCIVAGYSDSTRGTIRDYCGECIEAGRNDDNFGRCYVCRDFHDHEHCIGVPCQCPCPTPDQRQRAALREQALEKLTPEERVALGI